MVGARIAQSRYSDSLRWTAGGSNPGGGEIFLHPFRPALGPTQPPIKWVPGLFQGLKWPGIGVDHPPPSSAETCVACSRLNFTLPLPLSFVGSCNNVSQYLGLRLLPILHPKSHLGYLSASGVTSGKQCCTNALIFGKRRQTLFSYSKSLPNIMPPHVKCNEVGQRAAWKQAA